MRSSRQRGLFSRALITVSLVALLLVGMPVGPPVTAPGPGLDLGLGRLWGAVANWFSPAEAQATPSSPNGIALRKAAKPVPPKRVRELVGKRSDSAKVFELSDGQTQVELSAEPQHFRDSEGKWQDIDTTVRERGRDGYRFSNDSNAFRSDFGDRTDRLARFQLGNRRVALGIDGEARTLSPRIKGSTITYPQAFPGADLVYEVTSESLKEKIILAEPPAEPVYRFTLRVGGVTAKALPDGSIGFFAKEPGLGQGPPVFVMPKPFMNDSREDAKSPYGKAFSGAVTQTVEQRGANITVTVRADKEWLSAKEREYPVVIDPTIKIEPTPTTGQDAQIWSDTPDRNDGSDYRLSVGTDPWGISRSLLKFNVSSVPDGTSLTSARLRVYYDNELYTGANNVTIEARRITAPWSEDTVTWNSINSAMAEAGLSTQVKRAPTSRTCGMSSTSGTSPRDGCRARTRTTG